MFVFLGSYSGGGGGGSADDDDDSQAEEQIDNPTQTGVDDYTGNDGSDDSGDDSDGGKAAAAGAAGAADAAGAAAGGAGASGTAGSSAGAGTGTESPEGDDAEDADESEEEECEDEEEEQLESPDVEEPDIESEDDMDASETEENPEKEEEDEDEDEEEDETVVVVQEVDALSAMSWGVQPVMKHVEECYGEEIELFYKPAPVREIDPEQEKQRWIEVGQQVGMPVDPSFWDEDPPESTELVNKAFEAAVQQYRGEDYIRALWRSGVASGRDINDREILVDLASDLGLDRERFEEDLDEAELETGGRDELPFTFMEIQGAPVPKNGRVRYTDFKTQLTFQGIDEQEPQDLQGFVEEHGPVATPEIMEVYEIQRQRAKSQLAQLEGISSFETGGEQFWMP